MRTARSTRRWCAKLIRDAAGEALARELVFGEVTERDWVASSLAGLKPVEAGRFLVHGSHDRDKAARARIPIEIEAALAFGTGHHGTTRGCLIAFDRLIRSRSPRRVLDVGTGTGVLAIAAARMFHRRVVATDIDKVAVLVAIDNARLNRIAPLFHAIHAPGVDAHDIRRNAPYDLIFANILLPPLKLMAKPMVRLMAAAWSADPVRTAGRTRQCGHFRLSRAGACPGTALYPRRLGDFDAQARRIGHIHPCRGVAPPCRRH